MSVLYVVGTPIGNLSDMSKRAVDTLSSVDFIAAEDTRVTLKLLTHFGIKKPLISCYEHNIREKVSYIAGRIENGESCAIVTDAGMPCISDPGEELVRYCADMGIEVKVVPSPTAAMSALAISGLSTSRFSFEGFLSVTKKQRYEHLDEIKTYKRTLIFYEAPHKLKNTLFDLLDVLGDRKIALCRELTKIHEEVLRGNISDMIKYYSEKEPKGEYVIIVEGYKDKEIPVTDINAAAEMAREFISEGMKPSAASKKAAEMTGLSKSEIYSAVCKDN